MPRPEDSPIAEGYVTPSEVGCCRVGSKDATALRILIVTIPAAPGATHVQHLFPVIPGDAKRYADDSTQSKQGWKETR